MPRIGASLPPAVSGPVHGEVEVALGSLRWYVPIAHRIASRAQRCHCHSHHHRLPPPPPPPPPCHRRRRAPPSTLHCTFPRLQPDGGAQNVLPSGWSVRCCWWGEDEASPEILVRPSSAEDAAASSQGRAVDEAGGRCLFPLRTDRRRVLSYFADSRPARNMLRLLVLGPQQEVVGAVVVPLQFRSEAGSSLSTEEDAYSASMAGVFPVKTRTAANAAPVEVGQLSLRMSLRFGGASKIRQTLHQVQWVTHRRPPPGKPPPPAKRESPGI